MPIFKLHFRNGTVTEPDDDGMEFRDLHHAYLEVCRSIPDVARERLIEGQDPLRCAFLICDGDGRQLLEVRFDETLAPAVWRPRRASRPRTICRDPRGRATSLLCAAFGRCSRTSTSAAC